METEMEMRSSEEIEAGEDLTPPLPPLTFALHGQSPPSSDIRAALHLYHSLPSTSTSTSTFTSPRLFGLLTNHHTLMSSTDPDLLFTIHDGARQLAAALNDPSPSLSNGLALEESLLCLVMTNAVEVQDQSMGRVLGIAVYDTNFSWINHSCSPNACYRFLFSHSNNDNNNNNSTMRILPASSNPPGDSTHVSATCQIPQGGPSIIVRSIQKINKGEPVTIAYIDLLQPKAVRQSELWSKYRFVCCCKRCSASPPTYVDRVLEEISASNLELNSRLDCNFDRDKANQKLTDYMDEVIAEYLLVGDPESCCKKLENFLNQGLLFEQSQTEEGKVVLNLRLHPLHHLALNVYTTLASAYKIRSSDLLALDSDIDRHTCEAFDMSRISAAYSLLLAGATDHLFQSESSLIASAANFWVSAGESLVTLARSSGWNFLMKPGLPVSNSSLQKHKCLKCSLMDKLEVHSLAQNADFGNISYTFLDCITDLTCKVWTSLSYGCAYLQMYKDPIDFSWLQKSSNVWDLQAHSVNIDEVSYLGSKGSFCRSKPQLHAEEVKVSIFQLGVHCLLYGGHLASICYGENSHLTCQIHNVLCSE